MYDPVEERRAQRFTFLNRVYEMTDGDRFQRVDMRQIGSALGFGNDETKQIVYYLIDERLLEFAAAGGLIQLSHRGLKEIERARLNPKQRTTYFPPAINVIHIGRMSQSQIQQGTSQSVQSFAIDSQISIDSINAFIDDLKRKLNDLGLNDDDRTVVEAYVATLEPQLKSPRPDRTIINAALGSLRTVLLGATGNVIADGLLQALEALG